LGDVRAVRVWDLATGEQVGEPLTGNAHPVLAVATGVVDGRPVAVAGGEERFVDVVADLPADTQAAEVVQERERRFRHPPVDAKARAVFGAAPGDLRGDAQLTDPAAVGVVVVAAVGVHRLRAPSRALSASSYPSEPVAHRQPRPGRLPGLLLSPGACLRPDLGWRLRPGG
jgi:hypothetical protein